MKVYIVYRLHTKSKSWQALKAFHSEEKAKLFIQEKNIKSFLERDQPPLIQTQEYNYFEMEIE